MNHSLFLLINFAARAVFDVWLMGKSELVYWGLCHNQGIDRASNQASYACWSFWYFYVAFTGYILYGPSCWIDISTHMFLHWTGFEDVLFFFFANWIKLPDSWTKQRVYIKILGLSFPKHVFWLEKDRTIGKVIIPMYWTRLFGGKNMEFKRVAVGSVVALLIVLIIQSI